MKLKQERLFELMNEIDDDLILRAEKSGVQKGRGRRIWLRVGALAACVCLIVGVAVAVLLPDRGQPSTAPPVLDKNPSTTPPVGENEPSVTPPTEDDPPKVTLPVWENALYSADVIGNLFDTRYYGGGTSAYSKVYVTDSHDLQIDDLPDEEYLSVYRHFNADVAIDQGELEAFLDLIFPRLSQSLGVQFPPYEIEEAYGGGVRAVHWLDDCSVMASQTEGVMSVYLSASSGKTIVLDGETVRVDCRQNDAQVIASLEGLKTKLCQIFGVSFENAGVVRSYVPPYGIGGITVYLYNKDDHPLNDLSKTNIRPVGDFISIDLSRYSDDSPELILSNIFYMKRRVDATETYQVTESAKTISLADAEVLLYNGYVFGGHSCPICMKQQNQVSFEDYDFVDLEYVFAGNYDRSDLGIPFYAFYKLMGEDGKGTLIYAKTYVPAIEVKGYVEYFQGQERDHEGEEDEILPF